MYYKEFQGEKLSALGFGLMRLPCLEGGAIDQAAFEHMIDLAIEGGVNYFDTAFPYHGGTSEIAAGKALGRYPRESYNLATKYPGHQIVDEDSAENYRPDKVFNKQLEKCGVDYFDFYLLHNVYENSIQAYTDEKLGIVEYFAEQKRLGKIRHLGFSSHGKVDLLEKFLDQYGQYMEFCQIQLNYMDWDLQDAGKKVELLRSRGLGVWVMEPVRGGRLAKLAPEDEAKLKALRPDDSIASWALRYLQSVEGVTMTLSGMSNEAQMLDNLQTYEKPNPTTAEETALLYEIADKMGRAVPCTSCRYCCDGCPMGLDIPTLINTYNDLGVSSMQTPAMYLDSLPKEKWPHACLNCRKCLRFCPQGIPIPDVLKKLADKLDAMPSWVEVCSKRAAEAKKLEQEG